MSYKSGRAPFMLTSLRDHYIFSMGSYALMISINRNAIEKRLISFTKQESRVKYNKKKQVDYTNKIQLFAILGLLLY